MTPTEASRNQIHYYGPIAQQQDNTQHTTRTGPTVIQHENGQTAKAKSQLSDLEKLKMLK
jgi:hypothetical protein